MMTDERRTSSEVQGIDAKSWEGGGGRRGYWDGPLDSSAQFCGLSARKGSRQRVRR